MMTKNYLDKVADIQKNYKKYYEAFNLYVPFNGPSLHFHTRALELRKKSIKNESTSDDKRFFLEMIYAVLVSWGMHSRGARMVDFNVFEKSICDIWSDILKAQEYTPQNMNNNQWNVIKNIYKEVKIMSGNSHLVGSSKVMAHLLPSFVAPIDRRYTLSYLHENKNIPQKVDKQSDWFEEVTNGFYHKVFEGDNAVPLMDFCDGLVSENNNGWNTSRLKVIDNLVIGAKI